MKLRCLPCGNSCARCCGFSVRSKCSYCFSFAARCFRFLRQHVPWTRVALVMCLASLVSAMIPDAPLQRLLLSEEAERQRLLAENKQRLEHSTEYLVRYLHSPHGHRLDDLELERKQAGEEQHRLEDALIFQLPHHDHDQDPFPIGDSGRSPGLRTREGKSVDIAVTILTMERGRRLTPKEKFVANYSTQYLTQSVARLLELLQDTTLKLSYNLSICNIDDHPEQFQEALSLQHLLPVFWRYGEPESHQHEEDDEQEAMETTKGEKDDKEKKNDDASKKVPIPPRTVWEKLKEDYVFCLKGTLESGARYALLVEDDAVAHAHLFRVLEHVLQTVVEGQKKSPVAYIKLYHPRRLVGYISYEPERLAELFSLSLILGALLTLLLSARRNHTRNQRHQSQQRQHGGIKYFDPHSHALQAHHHHLQINQTIPAVKTGEKSLFHKHRSRSDSTNAVATQTSSKQSLWSWLGWTLTVAAFVLAIGRANLLELRRISPQLYQVSPTPSCCIPAVLYSKEGGSSFANFLTNVTCTAQRSTDIRMDEWRDGLTGGARGLMIQPSLFSHIGLVSSLRTAEVNPLIVQ